jgi:hypothetical protein
MSTWHRLAQEQFPELRGASVRIEKLVDLYSELASLLNRALLAEDAAIVQRVVAFALWGTTQVKNEQFVHCTTDLFRKIVESPSKRAVLWRHLTPSQFDTLKVFFADDVGEGRGHKSKDLEREYRSTPRPNSAFESGPPSAAAQRER